MSNIERLLRVFEHRISNAWQQDATASDRCVRKLHSEADTARDELLSALRHDKAERDEMRKVLRIALERFDGVDIERNYQGEPAKWARLDVDEIEAIRALLGRDGGEA